MAKPDSDKCTNGHPCDNEGYCRNESCYYSLQAAKERGEK